ncbi:MAG: hypothetical protein C0501_01260 [Isosphaera sp.]|nr:hypothetical protein [Isosphaera sp.]
MPRTIWSLTLVSLLASGIVSPVAAGIPRGQGAADVPPLEPKEGSVNNDYAGIVTKVTKDSITLQSINRPKDAPWTFGVSETLAAGKVPVEPRRQPGARYTYSVMPEYMYRLTDVKVGDSIAIGYARLNGADICDHIRIWRRPDGLVPPLPKEAEDLRDSREVWKTRHPGRPVPDVIANRRYTPYHEQQNAYWARIAPMPREVKIGPAVAP